MSAIGFGLSLAKEELFDVSVDWGLLKGRGGEG